MFELTFLGTAASTPSADRGLPAVLVQAGSMRFLVDCGEGTQRQLLRAGSGFRRLGHVLLTHAHLDHVLGLGGLIATLGLMDVRGPLRICGSGETVRFARQHLASLYPLPRAPVPLEFLELQPGPVLSSGGFSVTCFPVRHRGTQSLGYRFDTTPRRHLRADRLAALGVPPGPLRARLAAGQSVILPDGRRIDPDMVQGPPAAGASVAIVGDAEEVDSLIAPVGRADALVIEATFLEADAALAAERGHLTAAEAGRLAAEAKVGALYLMHISGRYDPADIAAEAGRYFPKVSVVNDFDRVSVTAESRS
ncbi:MAG: MBL fold metallo-hydrolase [Alphaproteobacteria bacterium]|nr:MBL fold metallo-hydrolase [Alphaproteobacteria bacterium]